MEEREEMKEEREKEGGGGLGYETCIFWLYMS
jgi:hypothetical protein